MEKFQELFDLVFSSIITPANLLENAKLDNYDYVNYSKSKDGLVVAMKCSMERGIKREFLYNFDKQDKLQTVIMISDQDSEVVFDRMKEIDNLKNEILKERQLTLIDIAG